MGTITGFIEVVAGKKVEAGVEYDIEGLKGKKIKVNVKNQEWNGRLTNSVDGFMTV
jgi:hypothetical protein